MSNIDHANMPNRIKLSEYTQTAIKNIKIEDVFIPPSEKEINTENHKSNNTQNKKKVKTIRDKMIQMNEKIKFLENSMLNISKEMDKIISNQKNIFDVINRLSTEIMISRNKITR